MALFQGDQVKRRVDILMTQLNPKPGDVFMHQDLAALADCEYPSHRYTAVIGGWRSRLLREMNIDIDNIVGIGYRVLDENERVDTGIRDFGRSRRRMGKSINRIQRADTDKLDDFHRRQQDHAKILQARLDDVRSAEKQIAIVGKVVPLPKKVVQP